MTKVKPLTAPSAGNGSIVHMVTEYFLDSVGADVLHIPYKGTSPALTDTIAGPEFYREGADEIRRTLARAEEARRELDDAYALWLEFDSRSG